LTNAKKGQFEKGFAFAGANAYRVKTITSVKKLIETLLAEYGNVAFNIKHSEILKQPGRIVIG
jgi:hypothetical protein